MNDNNKNKLILKAELTPDNKIQYDCYSKHVPTLTYISALIDAEVMEQITQQKLKAEMKDAPVVRVSDRQGLKAFLSRYKKKR